MSLELKKQELLAQLAALPDGWSRLAKVVERAKQLPPMDPSLKTDANLVEGCLSHLWFASEFRENHCYFYCDSNSTIVKGIAGILCEFYSGHEPAEILQHDPGFLGEVGITQHLSPNRRNALSRLWDQIRTFAQSHLPSS